MSSSLWADLNTRLSAEGFEWTSCLLSHLLDTQLEYTKLREQNLLSPSIEPYISGFNYSYPPDMEDMQSLFVLAIEDPIREFQFQYRGKVLRVLIPPTYLFYNKTRDKAQKIFNDVLQPHGYRTIHFRTAQKNVAVHSGLALYGRNNIAYYQKGHSGYRSLTFISNFPIKEDIWRDLRFLPECANCGACIQNCPTGALSDNRIPIDPSKCITLHNEKPAKVPFPDFITLPMHTCLVGCMECQKVCPKNKIMMQTRIFGGEFTESETELLLHTMKSADLPSSLVEKFTQFGLIDIAEELPRNLQMLLTKS